MAKTAKKKKDGPKSLIGAEKKEGRAKVQQVRTALKGKTIYALTNAQKDDLLLIIGLQLGLVDSAGELK